MAAANLNFDLLLSGILRDARRQSDEIAYLSALHAAALTAVKAGDEYVTSMTGEDGSSTAERGIPATMLLQIYELALQALEYEAAIEAGTDAAGASVRHGDFSSTPCTLG